MKTSSTQLLDAVFEAAVFFILYVVGSYQEDLAGILAVAAGVYRGR